MDEPRQIDWRTAVVKGGTLSVELTGEPSRPWAERMEAVLARLEPRRAAAIKVAKRRIKVDAVTEDSALELRHLLESAAQQANADLVSAPESDDPEAASGDGQLTQMFQEFGPPEPD